jgi:hypothetical protein
LALVLRRAVSPPVAATPYRAAEIHKALTFGMRVLKSAPATRKRVKRIWRGIKNNSIQGKVIMNDTFGRNARGRPGTVARISILAVLSVLIAGCGGGYEKLSSQPYDTDYEVFSVTSWSGQLDVFLVKAFESDGKVALCGGYTHGTSSFSTIGNRRWADLSQVYIEDTKIGTGEFMAQLPVYGFKDGEDPKALFIALQEKTPTMPCVRSKIPWKSEYGSAKLQRRGVKRLTVID